ncbi:pectinesterase 31 [Panicum miliaceum]|uniref:pectinesterase n=1 Tax=Panicum miliaceum TaxID=4540 RepID=A0A3L6TIW1_PANMI|nr:pectinesterase 31 [Panicum miliaceum]
MALAQQSRRVLQVAPPGKGDGEAFPTVQAAVDAVPLGNRARVVIRLAPGVYREPVYVAKTKNFITVAGAEGPEATVVSWDNTATRIKHSQSSRVIGTGTFGCGTFIVEGEDFIAENITFENSAPQGSGQAVAVRVTADRCAFYNCRFLGWQHFNVPFLLPGQMLRCIITGNGEAGYMFLGRPWGPFGRVVFAHTFMDRCIKPSGWHNWDKSENERTACFYEYRCSGPGSRSSNRVAWCRQLLDVEAEHFLSHTFIDPDLDRPWLLQMMSTRIPASA